MIQIFFVTKDLNYREWEPGCDEGHLEGVGVGVEGVKGIRAHGTHHGGHAARELVAN